MNQMQFLLLLLASIPFLACFFLRVFANNSALFSLTIKTAPIASLLVLVGIFNALKTSFSFSLINAAPGISFGFNIDCNSLGFLFLLNFFWIIFVFHAQRFFRIFSTKNADELQLSFLLVLSFLNLILISKNLLSALFFYNCLVIFSYFFSAKFLQKEENGFLRFFTFLLYLESFFFFLAIVVAHKFGAEIEFNQNPTFLELDNSKHAALLILYLLGLFFALFLPSYVFYRKTTLDLLTTYIFLFFGYAFASLYIFTKLLNFTFGFDEFSSAISKIGFGFFEWIFLLNIALVSAFLLLSKNFKTSFFYLFFQQFLTCLFSIFLFANFDNSKIYLPILSFFLSFSLIFFCFSNFILHFTTSTNKSFDGSFYKLTITSSLLIFALLNMAGFAPGIGAVEKFFLLKIIAKKKLIISGASILLSSFTTFIFLLRNFYRIFLQKETHKKEKAPQENVAETQIIDSDSSLMLGAFALALMLFLSAIFFPFLTKFFNPTF